MSEIGALAALVREWQEARKEAVTNDFKSWQRLADAEAALAAFKA